MSGNWATVILQDVYQGLEPAVQRGEVKQICVVQEIEKSTFTPLDSRGAHRQGLRRQHGVRLPVSAGLVRCHLLAEKGLGHRRRGRGRLGLLPGPVRGADLLLALDAEGRAVQRMRTFTHMMPGEVQGCVGCHANRNSVSQLAVTSLAAARPPQRLTPPDWGVGGFQYPVVVQPVLDKHCVRCHNEREHPQRVDLSGDKTDFFSVSYDVLARMGTMGETRPQQHNALIDSGEEGSSPFTSWIWTINGTERNILQIEPMTWGSPRSRLAELIRSGHPDENGQPRVDVPDEDRRRVYLWIDLNVPYYGTSASNHQDRMGSRRMLPPELEPVLNEVASRRCVSCHDAGVPREFYTRMLKPENNSFLLAPLAKQAGGTEACGQAIFTTQDDPDYQKILAVFAPIQDLLKRRPRADMPGFVMPPCSELHHLPIAAVIPTADR